MDFYQTWTSLDRFVTGICSLFFSNCKLQWVFTTNNRWS
jgi:hypothetical protein